MDVFNVTAIGVLASSNRTGEQDKGFSLSLTHTHTHTHTHAQRYLNSGKVLWGSGANKKSYLLSASALHCLGGARSIRTGSVSRVLISSFSFFALALSHFLSLL